MEEKNNSFEGNFNKLQSLVEDLDNKDVAIDDLVPRMKEALESIKVCKDVLQKTKLQLTEVEKEFKEIEKEFE